LFLVFWNGAPDQDTRNAVGVTPPIPLLRNLDAIFIGIQHYSIDLLPIRLRCRFGPEPAVRSSRSGGYQCRQ
jgi:hypothetical protein